MLKIPEDFDIIRVHYISREGKDQIRLIIAAFLNFETKEQILHVAWATEELIYKGAHIFFDHNFTFKVKQQRALYRPMREQLKSKNIKSHGSC